MDPLKKERFKNWFYYHKWPLFSGIAALLVIGITTNPLLRTLMHPADYMVADQLAMDISSCDSLFFLMEDAGSFQAAYGVLRFSDGKLPALDDYGMAGKCIQVGQCPRLTCEFDGITETEKEFLCGLSLGVRGFWTKKTCKHEEAGEILWKQILECLE
jgi:hypothetical protein